MTGAPEPANVQEVLDAVPRLIEAAPGMVGVALVGSWACAAGRASSDVDLVVLSDKPESFLDTTAWFGVFGEGTELFRDDDFGLLQERRLRRADGLVVEVCVGRRDWAATDPPDPGSARVARDGMRVLFDPHGLLATFAAAVG